MQRSFLNPMVRRVTLSPYNHILKYYGFIESASDFALIFKYIDVYIFIMGLCLCVSGKMFPTIGDVHLAPFTDEQLYMEQFTKANFW